MLILMLAAQMLAPDIQFNARIRAKEVRIEQKGTATLRVHAEPDAGSKVTSNAPRAGETVLRDADISVDAAVRLGEPSRETHAQPN